MTWQPIATAPTDRIILLYRPTAIHPAIRIAPGKFDDDKYAKKPKPYWEIWLVVWNGKTESRNFMPTHWCDYPLPPTAELEALPND